MRAPVFVICLREIEPKMCAARFFSPERGAGDERGDRQEVARGERERRTRDLLELEERAVDTLTSAQQSDALPHQSSDALTHGERDSFRASRSGMCADRFTPGFCGAPLHAGTLCGVLARCGSSGACPENQSFKPAI